MSKYYNQKDGLLHYLKVLKNNLGLLNKYI